MSHSLFGEQYFATRERLTDVMRWTAELALESGADLGDILPLDEIENGILGKPFVFVVCGEVNAGKSTLINGLFGHDLCRVNILPETQRVYWYLYGSHVRNDTCAPLLEKCFRPIHFLRNFNLIDTPGTNSIQQDHQEITESFLPTADLILFVFPVMNPWGASTWNFISRLPKDALNRVIFIIQQADRRESNEIQITLGHMADLSMKRIGHVPPIFAVSGKSAYDAKLATPFTAARLKTSGYSELENHISKNVCHSPQRKTALESWHQRAASALRTVEDHIEDQSRGVSDQNRFIEQIEREIDGIRETFVTRLPRHLSGVAAAFETEATWVTQQLRQRLGALPSLMRLFVGDRTAYEMESLFIDRLQAAVVAVAQKDGEEAADACLSHWNELGARVKEAMGIDLNAVEPIDETLSTAKERFVQRLGRAAGQGIGNLKVRNQLHKELARRNEALKSFIVMTLVFTTAAGTCGALHVPWLPWILCGIAAFFLTGSIWSARVTRKAVTREFQHRLLDTCGAFASALHSDYEEALRIIFRDYASSLGNVRTHLARERVAIEPRQRRWQELFLTLKAIEQDL